jgi:hypothetical protein
MCLILCFSFSHLSIISYFSRIELEPSGSVEGKDYSKKKLEECVSVTLNVSKYFPAQLLKKLAKEERKYGSDTSNPGIELATPRPSL